MVFIHPISYFSEKFDKHQRNYSTIEKECLALILALEHIDVYLGTTVHPVFVFTDHSPRTFIHRMKNKSEVEFDLAKNTIWISGTSKRKTMW